MAGPPQLIHFLACLELFYRLVEGGIRGRRGLSEVDVRLFDGDVGDEALLVDEGLGGCQIEEVCEQ